MGLTRGRAILFTFLVDIDPSANGFPDFSSRFLLAQPSNLLCYVELPQMLSKVVQCPNSSAFHTCLSEKVYFIFITIPPGFTETVFLKIMLINRQALRFQSLHSLRSMPHCCLKYNFTLSFPIEVQAKCDSNTRAMLSPLASGYFRTVTAHHCCVSQFSCTLLY